MAEPVIYREEVVRLLFSVYDISETVANVYDLLRNEEDDDGEEAESE